MNRKIEGVLLDLDGVFYVDDQLIPGGLESLHFLRERKIPYRFVTNNTQKSRKAIAQKLTALGLTVKAHEILSANYLGVLYLQQQHYSNVRLVVQEEGMDDYPTSIQTEKDPEAILIGDIGKGWTFDLMNELMQQIIAGAQLIALHKGRFFATQQGLQIDAGAFVAGLEYVTHQKAVVLGKPEPDFFRLALAEIGCSPEKTLMVGDDLFNDIAGAQTLGIQTALVRTGKFQQAWTHHPEHKADFELSSIATLPELWN